MKLTTVSLLYVLVLCDLDRTQNTKSVEMQMNNKPVETFWLTHKTDQCA